MRWIILYSLPPAFAGSTTHFFISFFDRIMETQETIKQEFISEFLENRGGEIRDEIANFIKNEIFKRIDDESDRWKQKERRFFNDAELDEIKEEILGKIF